MNRTISEPSPGPGAHVPTLLPAAADRRTLRSCRLQPSGRAIIITCASAGPSAARARGRWFPPGTRITVYQTEPVPRPEEQSHAARVTVP